MSTFQSLGFSGKVPLRSLGNDKETLKVSCVMLACCQAELLLNRVIVGPVLVLEPYRPSAWQVQMPLINFLRSWSSDSIIGDSWHHSCLLLGRESRR